MLNEQPKKGKTQHQRESFSKGKRENLGKRLGKTLITVIIIIINNNNNNNNNSAFI